MADLRTAAVEGNLLTFFTAARRIPFLRADPATDVDIVSSDVPFPMFNAVTNARFGEDTLRRTTEVVDSFGAAGRPWMWWLTPSTTSPDLEGVLEDRGLERDDTPGMYADLDRMPRTRPVDGLVIETSHDARTFTEVMVAGFGMPDLVLDPMTVAVEHLPGTIDVIASLDGERVASGTAFVADRTAGLYNITTVEAARGRGVGYAVTVALMELAREAGAVRAVLHASEAGLPVYERAGFTTVCEVPQYVWTPPEN